MQFKTDWHITWIQEKVIYFHTNAEWIKVNKQQSYLSGAHFCAEEKVAYKMR